MTGLSYNLPKEGIAVQDIIKKIVEIDRMAQKMTSEALELKTQAEESVEKDKKALREQYIQRAQRRIGITADTEEKFLRQSLDEIAKKYDEATANLQTKFNGEHEKWVSEIYTRVIGG